MIVDVGLEGELPIDWSCIASRGASGIRSNVFHDMPQADRQVATDNTRLRLAEKLFQISCGEKELGAAPLTLVTRYRSFRAFVRYVDDEGKLLSLSNLIAAFADWASHLEQRKLEGALTAHSQYALVTRVGTLISKVLELPRSEVMVGVRLKKPKTTKRRSRDKQNLEITQKFVGDVGDVLASLNDAALLGSSPIEVLIEGAPAHTLKRRAEIAAVPGAFSLTAINLRMAAEFSLFVAATGLNRAVASQLVNADFTYRTTGERVEVRAFKDRAGSVIEFSIEKRYRHYLDRFRHFRRTFYQGIDSDRLFVTIRRDGKPHPREVETRLLAVLLEKNGRVWVPPSILRKTKGNKLARLASVSAAARTLQNTAAVIDQNYLYAAHQEAAVEMSAYFRLLDEGAPIRKAVGPGACAGPAPEQIEGDAPHAPLADCRSAAGCLFCRFNRGLETVDYVWSLVSFNELKRIEYSRYRHIPPLNENSALAATLRRLQTIFDYLRSQERLRPLLEEAESCAMDGHYHPRWRYWIELAGI